MLNLNNLDKWRHLASGETIHLTSEKMRKVRLHVNAQTRTSLFYQKGDVERHLATVDGLETIQFVISGSIVIMANNDVAIYTSEVEKVHIAETGEVSFTKIVTRKPRNLEFEAMMHTANMNAERRNQILFQKQEDSYADLLKRINLNEADQNSVRQSSASDVEASSKPSDVGSASGSSENSQGGGSDEEKSSSG